MIYIRFEKRLEEVQAKYQVKIVVHEQTLQRGGAATEIANGLKALATTFLFLRISQPSVTILLKVRVLKLLLQFTRMQELAVTGL